MKLISEPTHLSVLAQVLFQSGEENIKAEGTHRRQNIVASDGFAPLLLEQIARSEGGRVRVDDNEAAETGSVHEIEIERETPTG